MVQANSLKQHQTVLDWIEQCFTSSYPTQYRLYGWRDQKTQPTVSKYWRNA